MKLIKVKTRQLYKLIDISPNLPFIKEKSRKVPVYICELTQEEYLKLTKSEKEDGETND